MDFHRDSVDIVIQTPAKLNLFFEVLCKRADGFHEIETLMVPIGLYVSAFLRRIQADRYSLTVTG